MRNPGVELAGQAGQLLAMEIEFAPACRLRCPHCGAQMRLLAAIEDPEVARKILGRLGLPARGPPLGAAPGVSVDSAHESWDEDALWDFDQTPPGG